MAYAKHILQITLAFTVLVPDPAFAANFTSHLTHIPQSFRSGKITSISGQNLIMHSTDGKDYEVNTTDAKFIRLDGSAISDSEVLVGDKLKIRGIINGNNINAVSVRNDSLLIRTASYYGTIVQASSTSFILLGSRGNQNIRYSNSTIFRVGNAAASWENLEAGLKVTVLGTWDRSYTDVLAKKITVKKTNIELKGIVSGKTDILLHVRGYDGIQYIVDISGSKLLTNLNSPMALSAINLNDEVQIKGTKLSGSNFIAATWLKNKYINAR